MANIEVLDYEEAAALFKTCNTRYTRGKRNLALLKTLFNSGLRVSEICNLKDKDISLDKQYILVKEGKGKKDRKVPIPDDAIPYLRAWSQEKAQRGIQSEYFFCCYSKGKEGRPLLSRYIQIQVNQLAKKAGIQRRVHPHLFRHTYATSLYQQTKDLEGIRKLLGHSRINTTQIYISLSDTDLKNTIIQFKAY